MASSLNQEHSVLSGHSRLACRAWPRRQPARTRRGGQRGGGGRALGARRHQALHRLLVAVVNHQAVAAALLGARGVIDPRGAVGLRAASRAERLGTAGSATQYLIRCPSLTSSRVAIAVPMLPTPMMPTSRRCACWPIGRNADAMAGEGTRSRRGSCRSAGGGGGGEDPVPAAGVSPAGCLLPLGQLYRDADGTPTLQRARLVRRRFCKLGVATAARSGPGD